MLEQSCSRERATGTFGSCGTAREAPCFFIVGCLQHSVLRMVPSVRALARSAALRAGCQAPKTISKRLLLSLRVPSWQHQQAERKLLHPRRQFAQALCGRAPRLQL